MADYKTLYHKLYNLITDVVVQLQEVQQEMEELHETDEGAKLIVVNCKEGAEKPDEKDHK